jgi:hypothetical protein
MPFSPEIQADFERLEKESRERVAKMTDAEREELRRTSRAFARKHRSCYYDVEPGDKSN